MTMHLPLSCAVIRRILGEIYPYQVLNRIGAGDAFMSGIIHGLIEQYPIEDTLDFATKCAVLQQF